jgi:hypothetical protein
MLAQSPSPEDDPRERRADDGKRDEQAQGGEEVSGDDRLRAHGEGAIVHGRAMIAPAPGGARCGCGASTAAGDLTVFNGNGLTGPGTALHVAWRCSPRCPGEGRQPWVRGGTNVVGESYDGALPDPYLGIEPMLQLMKGYADAARRPSAAAD